MCFVYYESYLYRKSSEFQCSQEIENGGIFINYFYVDFYNRNKSMNIMTMFCVAGAYYCFNTIKGKNYEDTIIAVKEYADRMKIPYRSVEP